MRYLQIVLMAMFLFQGRAMAVDGLTVLKSSNTVQETANKLELMVAKKGMTLFARIKHGENVTKVDYEMPAMELLIFGNPKVGGPLMKSWQTIGIDLPFKALIWEDEKGVVWFGYNEPRYLAKRHGVKEDHLSIMKASKVLESFAQGATAP